MIAAGVLAIGEIATLGFFLGPIAVAASLAAVVALLGAGLAVQWVVFIAASLGSVLVLRPIARRHLRTPASLRTGTAALVGGPATVIERVDKRGKPVRDNNFLVLFNAHHERIDFLLPEFHAGGGWMSPRF